MKPSVILPLMAGMIVAGLHGGAPQARPERLALIGGAETTIYVPARIEARHGEGASADLHRTPSALDRHLPPPHLIGEQAARLLC